MSRKVYTPTPDDLELVQKLKEVGSTDKEIARVLGISYTTFKKYKNDLFDPHILKGKEIRKEKLLSLVDDAVERMISGYYVEETQKHYNGDTLVRTTVKSRYVRPNARLLIFLLCNLDPENYKPINKIEAIPVQTAPAKGFNITFTKPKEYIA